MAKSITNEVISKFLSTENPEVLAIKGDWGVGKTYAWKQKLDDMSSKNQIALKKYSYVSLFGISSIQDLKNSIYINIISSENIKQENKIVMQKLKSKLSEILKTVPYAKTITVGIDTLASLSIKDMIICFDDFERLIDNEDKITVDEVLGFISDLKEEKKCKVVLIFNDKKMTTAQNALYIKYREKVIDKEVTYSPTAQESFKLVFSKQPQESLITQYCQLLDIKNIRVLHKIEAFVEMLNGDLVNVDQDIWDEVLKSLILVAASFYSPNDQIPTFDTFDKDRNVDFLFQSKKNAKEEDQEEFKEFKKLKDCLMLFKKYHLTDIDFSIIKMVRQGYIEDSGLLDEIEKRKTQIYHNQKQEYYQSAWNIYRHSFHDNQDVFINSLVGQFKKNIIALGLNELNNTASILCELDKESLAHELVDYFFEENSSNLPKEYDYNFSFHIQTSIIPYLKEKIDKYIKHLIPKIPLREALIHIYENRGWSQHHEVPIQQASEDDFYQLFKQENSEDIYGIVKTALERSREKAMNALYRIASENPLNALRIKSIYEVDISKHYEKKSVSKN